MYILPEPSMATPLGVCNCAFVAAPPSPESPGVPVPATVEIIPAGVIFLTHAPPCSAQYIFPALSKAIPLGSLIVALVAGPPSPVCPEPADPAMVVIIPAVTLRILLLPQSAIYMFPAASTTEVVDLNSEWVVATPSPLKVPVPFPAIVVMICACTRLHNAKSKNAQTKKYNFLFIIKYITCCKYRP